MYSNIPIGNGRVDFFMKFVYHCATSPNSNGTDPNIHYLRPIINYKHYIKNGKSNRMG